MAHLEREHAESVARAVSFGIAGVSLSMYEYEQIALALLAEGWEAPKPTPVTEEPLDPAVRLVGNNDFVFARVPNGLWVASNHNPLDWRDLVEIRGPLYLVKPGVTT